MASTIKIKRSEVSGNPSILGAGELAYSALVDNGSNGGDRLYVGMGTETAGNAVNHVIIGGKFFTDMLDHTKGVLTANSSIITDSDSKINNLKVDNLDLDGNTLSSTNTNGDLFITPNGSGKLVLTSPYIGSTSVSLQEYIYDTIGGALTGGTGITVTTDDINDTATISISNSGVTAGSYGSTTAIPVITVNAQGQLTSVTTASITTSLGITSDSGSDTIALATDTLVIAGGEGIDTSIDSGTNTLTIAAEDASTSNKGVASFADANFTVTSGAVSTKNITLGTSTLTNGSTTSSIAGLESLSVDNITINGNEISSINEDGNISLNPNGTGTVEVNNARITGLANPTQDSDAATKYYVDTVAEGLSVKPAVRVATTEDLGATYDNGTLGVGSTLTIPAAATLNIDGVTNWSLYDGILVKDQTNAFENGRYFVSTIGNISTAWVLTRCAKCDEPSEIPSMYIFVQEGSTYASTGWVASVEDFPAFDVGIDDIIFTQFSGAGTYLAGNGLTITGSTFDVVGTANRIAVNADSIDIASTYVGQTSITTLGTISSGTWQGTVVDGQYGGTGVANTGKTITLGGNLVTSGANSTTFTTTGTTDVTLPTTGTLATLTGTESLSNKTITSSSFAGTTIDASGLITFTNNTQASAIGTAAVVLSGGISVAKTMYIGNSIYGAGAATSLLDGFSIDGGTY